jgi:hypothetical protein
MARRGISRCRGDPMPPPANGARFTLGDVVATPGALDALRRNHAGAWTYLRRHVTGDWGDLDTEDVAENELSLVEGFRLFSRYTLPDGTRLWVITEADRSCTTLLLPEEY